MKSMLIVPDSKERGMSGVVRRSKLTLTADHGASSCDLGGVLFDNELIWTVDHSASSYGLGVMIYDNGDVLDGWSFRELRDRLGAVIETDDLEKVCRALGVPIGEPGISSGH